MKNPLVIVLSGAMAAALLVAGALAQSPPVEKAPASFAEARKGFVTKIGYKGSYPEPLPKPPAGVFNIVKYPAAPGPLEAYITPDPGGGKRLPAIIWITGGESNSLDEMWEPGPRTNDQSATAYRTPGLVLMLPTLRGGNANPGKIEAYFGEVDDVLAAADYLATLPYVDPQRIYLGGHSTGGTLALLTAEASTRFRAVFSFGPVGSVVRYGTDLIPVEFKNYPAAETLMRQPSRWLESVKSPLFVIEGMSTTSASNWTQLALLDSLTDNPSIKFLMVNKADHFTVLAPANEVIARKILADTGPATNITLTTDEIAKSVARRK